MRKTTALGLFLVLGMLMAFWLLAGARIVPWRGEPRVSVDEAGALISTEVNQDGVRGGPTGTSPSTEDSRPKAPLSAWFAEESRRLDEVHADAEGVRLDLERKAALLTRAEGAELAAIAADEEASLNSRTLAVYLLTLRPAYFQSELVQVLDRPIRFDEIQRLPHAFAEVLTTKELAFNVQILRSLEPLSLRDPRLLDELENVARRSTDPRVRQDIQSSVIAARQGRMHWSKMRL